MGPRLVSRGKVLVLRTIGRARLRLQWGRDLLVAERCQRAKRTLPQGALQWGRDLLVAESDGGSRMSQPLDLLQWGRDLLVAER